MLPDGLNLSEVGVSEAQQDRDKKKLVLKAKT
jgi:hypothetical protein